MARILICDDAAAFSLLLSRWIEDDKSLDVVGTTSDPDEALALVAELRPDVVVLDHLLGASTSATLVPQFRVAAPGVRVLLISGMPADVLARAAAEAGADAFATKASRAEQICDAVRALAT